MGYAHGELMQEKAKSMMDDVWSYLENQVVYLAHSKTVEHTGHDFFFYASQVDAINGTIDIFPKWFLDDVANVGCVDRS